MTDRHMNMFILYAARILWDAFELLEKAFFIASVYFMFFGVERFLGGVSQTYVGHIYDIKI